MPEISIGLPVYNGENFIAQSIDSILAQRFGDFELIISDNASTDNTQQICQNYQDARIRYVRAKNNRGASWNFNETLRLAQGRFFKWAAHDDMMHPNFLEDCRNALLENPKAVVAHGEVECIDALGNSLGPYPFKPFRWLPLETRMKSSKRWLRFWEISFKPHRCYPVFGLIRADIMRKTAGLQGFVHADRVFLAHLALYGPFVKIPKILFYSRRHEGQSERMLNKPAQYARWFDAARREKRFFPYWNLFRAYSKILRDTPMPGLDRATCKALLACWPLWKFPYFIMDLFLGFGGSLPWTTKTPTS